MITKLICFCLFASAQVFAQESAPHPDLESALDQIASYHEIPAAKFWFSPTIYRFGGEVSAAGLAVEMGARISQFVVNRFYSLKSGRLIETLRIGSKSAIAVGNFAWTFGSVITFGEMLFAWRDGYHGVFPSLFDSTLGASLMGSPQGYQRVIAMAKLPTGRETLRKLATQNEEFYKFLIEFDQPKPATH